MVHRLGHKELRKEIEIKRQEYNGPRVVNCHYFSALKKGKDFGEQESWASSAGFNRNFQF